MTLSFLNQLPRVSCIMPTANRTALVKESITLFAKQTYPNKELIIVDDGNPSLPQELIQQPFIRYTQLAEKKSIGEKRNIACHNATGEVILHWDDDDWYGKNWISSQVQELVDQQADITGLKQVYFFDPLEHKAWIFNFPLNQPWVCGSSMGYKKSFWEKNRFPHVSQGEDDKFMWSLTLKKIAPHNHINQFAVRVHSQNTIPKQGPNMRLKPVSYDIIREMMHE